jgi:hypothetical protein
MGDTAMQNQVVLRPAVIATERETADRRAGPLGAADWLSLAAAPVFATMALISGASGDARPDFLCSAMPGASALSGMVPMYVLMSAFHLAPWLRLVAGRIRSSGD